MGTRGPNYKVRNRNAIKRGFTNLKSYGEKMSEVVMRNMARDGLHSLLNEHDIHEAYLNHTCEDNTLAYALAHNGAIIESGYHNGGDDELPGDAKAQAEEIARSHNGYCAVILSDMMGWYKITLEEDLLNAARGDIQDHYGSNLFGKSEYLVPGAIPKPQ